MRAGADGVERPQTGPGWVVGVNFGAGERRGRQAGAPPEPGEPPLVLRHKSAAEHDKLPPTG
jgi:hypothetical protein